MAALPHRNIVAVYDIVTNDDIAYIVMEYLDGGTLSERMRSGVSLGQALSVIVQTASALEYAHTRGIIHRDLKPANIMFRDGVVPVLTDFGIARQRDSAAAALTQAGMMVGTPQYMSPEQINGQLVDGRADQYSLGVLLYELLTGAPPFTGDTTLAVLMSHLTKEAPPLPAEFADFQDVVSRMLAKDREQRYANLNEFVAELKSRLTRSDTLLTRLQLNPDQSTSDQLRDLGFDAMTPSSLPRMTGSGSLAGARIALQGTGATPAPVAQPSLWTRPAWKWTGAAFAILALVLSLWLMLGRKHELTHDEQELVQFRIEKAELRLQTGKLIGDDSAYQFLQEAKQKDPNNMRANELVAQIAANLAASAQAALGENKLDQALELSNESLLVRPDVADVQALKTKIADTQKAARNKQQIDALVQAAETARTSGKLFGEGSAYASLLRARALVPTDADVQRRIRTLIDDELGKTQKQIDSGEFAAAGEALAALEPYLGSEPAYAQMKTRLGLAQKQQQTAAEIIALLDRANAQLRAGHLVSPVGENAAQSLGELRKIAGADARSAALAKSLGQALLAEARKQDAANQPALAIENVEFALQADPQTAGAQDFKTQIEQRLGQRAAGIARALSTAQAALNEQRFVPPTKNDAYSALQELLKLDPENATGKGLLAELPKRIATAAQAGAAKDAAGASDLIEAALKLYPVDTNLVSVQAQLSAQLARESAEKAAQARRDRIAVVVGAAAPDVDKLKGAAQELDALFAVNDASAETRTLRTRLIEAIGNRIRASDAISEFDAAAALLNDERKNLAADAAYGALVGSLPDLRAKAVATEQARLEAERGELVLNAFPWARIEAVVDANGKAVALPPDTVTPLTLTLPAGSYRITFKHPNATQATQVIAKVDAKKRNAYNAAFPTISARGYFTRAGF
ncbi:MAG: serine/threonine protein kinase [Gammaproteobacteria bacterium]|nr:MAG: serine/threonine protein kinase [Gammaproteobacteria bacterium]